jgi:hypothetical protein
MRSGEIVLLGPCNPSEIGVFDQNSVYNPTGKTAPQDE